MSFSEHLKPPPKQLPLSLPAAFAVWLGMALFNCFFYAWLWIGVEGSRSSFSNADQAIVVMHGTALLVSIVSFCCLVRGMQHRALVAMVLVLPLALGTLFLGN